MHNLIHTDIQTEPCILLLQHDPLLLDILYCCQFEALLWFEGQIPFQDQVHPNSPAQDVLKMMMEMLCRSHIYIYIYINQASSVYLLVKVLSNGNYILYYSCSLQSLSHSLVTSYPISKFVLVLYTVYCATRTTTSLLAYWSPS